MLIIGIIGRIRSKDLIKSQLKQLKKECVNIGNCKLKQLKLTNNNDV